jgi:hypothetical protein
MNAHTVRLGVIHRWYVVVAMALLSARCTGTEPRFFPTTDVNTTLPTTPLPEPATHTLRGTVTSAVGGQPIPNATVSDCRHQDSGPELRQDGDDRRARCLHDD